jgi:hypothetical protein
MGIRRGAPAAGFMTAIARAEGWRSRRAALAGRIALLVVLGALLAGCDKCGGWYWGAAPGETQACRQQAPQPQ